MDDLPIQQQADHTASKAENAPSPLRADSGPTVNPGPQSQSRKRNCCRTLRKAPNWIEAACAVVLVGITGFYTYYAHQQVEQLEKSTDAAKHSADTAHDAFVLGQRPWIKIKHRIIQPLTFDVPRWKGPIASMVIEDTLENVGQSIALNVFSWEDVLPMNSMGNIQTARARQTEWCDANRHRNSGGLSGYMLFPKEPFIQHSMIGPFMKAVNKAADSSPGDLRGKVGFVLVGCVVYRSSFEPPTAPAHETKFIYWLGEPLQAGGIQPYVKPTGVARKLQLVTFPDGFSAD